MRFFGPLRSFIYVLLPAGILVWPGAAAAHPHVWVTVETEVLYGEQQTITGFRHKWAFDEAYSSFAILGLDKDGDGKYSREELQEVAEVNVSSLKEFGYFTFPKLAGTDIERLPPKDYWLEYKDGVLTLFLTLPLKEPVPKAETDKFTFAVYDPTFYVDFALAKETPVRLASAPAGCEPVIKDPDPVQRDSAPLSSAGEGFYDTLDATSTIAAQYAKSVSIACPAS